MYKGIAKVWEIAFVAGTFIETSGLIEGVVVLPFFAATSIVVTSAFTAKPHKRSEDGSFARLESLENAENVLKKL
jgi:hypothetical protein